jgi:hypothetical protein
MKRLFLYLKYFFEADTKTVRDRACKEAREWCLARHPHHWTDNYYRDFRRFSQSYMRSYCHEAAKAKLAYTHPR